MRSVKVQLQGLSPISFSKYVQEPKLDKESAQDYEERTWRERLHYDEEGMVFVPAMMLKNCLSGAAKFLSVQIPGRGKATYTKHFEAGIMVTENSPLNIHKDDVPGEWLFVPADGKRGGGRRVAKCFPKITKWEIWATFHILDDTITRDVFEEHLREAGSFIGLGRFRPRNNGYYGRFKPVEFVWN